MNPKLLGVRLDMLLYLYRRRVRAHPLAELLAGAGVAVGVALVFGVLLANASLTSSATRLAHVMAGSARFELVARSAQGTDEQIVQEAGELDGVQVAAPVLRENVTLSGPAGRQAVQLIGLTPSLEDLGGASTQQLGAGSALLKGGLGVPSRLAAALGVREGTTVRIASYGRLHEARVRLVLSSTLAAVSDSPVAVAALATAQRLSGRPGRVSEVLIRPSPGAQERVRNELATLAGARHLDLRPASAELDLLRVATRPNQQSTSLFTAIAVMLGFLLALNAVLLTVPERRRFVAELRMQGYDPAQIVLLLVLQALVLGAVASLVGLALGWLLSALFFEQVPGFLTVAFPIGAEETVRFSTVAVAVTCGVLASALASLAPVLDLRAGRLAGSLRRERTAHSEAIAASTVKRLALAGTAMLAVAAVVALLVPSATIEAGVVLAGGCVCLVPGLLSVAALVLPRVLERLRSSAVIVALTETSTTTTRSAALAAIAALAVYGCVAIGGAREDLLRGIDQATQQYFATAPIWVTDGRDVFNTNSFPAATPAAAIGRVPGVASVRVYRGGLLDVGDRRMWVRARPAGDDAVFEASQLREGEYARATRLIRGGKWAAVSSDFASERHLRLGSSFELPTPVGTVALRVAAITTNSGWPAGTLTLSGQEYGRLWGAGQAAALEVSLRPGTSEPAALRAVRAALGPRSGLQALTSSQRGAESSASARQGLRTLGEISTLLLIAAALSVACALSAAVWQRRLRIASLKMLGYDARQLWCAVLIESAVTIGVGALLGALVGVAGHALASRYLALSTGFPAPFMAGPEQVLSIVTLFGVIALAVLALPGMFATRVSPRAVLAE